MLAYLLLYQHRHPHTAGPRRDLLANQFWGDYDERHARRCLSTTLWRLRSALEANGVPAGTYILTSGNDEVGFNFASDHWLDVVVFEREIDERLKQPPATMTPADVEALEKACSLYKGDLFQDCYDDWILRERERLHLLYLKCLGHLMQYHDQKGEYGRSLEYGRKILASDPLREQVHRYMMRLYLRNGEQSQAVQQYHTCRRVLRSELGIEPMAETQALYAELVATATEPRAAASLIDQVAPGSLALALQQLRDATQALETARVQLQEAKSLLVRLASRAADGS
jgi:DNA-binding SARP family transcriptional activator